MGWSNYTQYDDFYDDDHGANDEYRVGYCHYCHEETEHDVCTDECVNCGG